MADHNTIPTNDPLMAANLSARFGITGSETPIVVPPLAPWPKNWFPIDGDCHGNAQRWAALHPDFDVVHGWLHIAGEPGFGASFEAHTVVRDPGRKLVDVTKRHGTQHLFLKHDGPADVYLEKSRQGGPWVHVVELRTSSEIAELMALQVRSIAEGADDVQAQIYTSEPPGP